MNNNFFEKLNKKILEEILGVNYSKIYTQSFF